LATASKSPRKRRTLERALPPAPGTGWWGDGAPPWERWAGVTIATPCTWNARHQNADGAFIGRWESTCGKFYFDQDAADRAVDFFPEFLTHHIGEFKGEPFKLLPYQELLLTRPIFGWKRVDNGMRRFRKVFAFIPKGAGKSPWGAGTALFMMLCDDEPAAEVYVCAGDKEQARVVHSNAKVMVEESQELDNMCEILKDSIYDPTTRSALRVLSSDAATKHGFRPSGIVFDEIHNQKNRDLFEALTKSTVKRRQPLTLIITHAGTDDEGIAYEEYELAKQVLSGTSTNATVLPVMFEASASDDWTDPAVWARVNPAHGLLVKHDAIEAECADAIAEPRKRNDFLRYHLNRWVNQATAWIPIDWWDACRATLDDAELRELPVFAGLDMSQKYDLTAFVLVFPRPIDGPAMSVEVKTLDENEQKVTRTVSLNIELSVVPFFWLPEDTLRERVKKDRVPYDQWREAGLLRVTEGNVIDYDRVLGDITGEISDRFPRLKGAEVGYDPAFATDIATKLAAKGYQTVELLQTYKYLSEPSHIVEALIKSKRVRHDGHRLLRWNWENVAIRSDDAGRIRPVKPKRAVKRIDGVVGMIMGASRAVFGDTPQSSIYESGGIDFL
jgi:phage terminase large subunit-like protein